MHKKSKFLRPLITLEFSNFASSFLNLEFYFLFLGNRFIPQKSRQADLVQTAHGRKVQSMKPFINFSQPYNSHIYLYLNFVLSAEILSSLTANESLKIAYIIQKPIRIELFDSIFEKHFLLDYFLIISF